MRVFHGLIISFSLISTIYMFPCQNGSFIYPFIFATMLVLFCLFEIEKQKLIVNEYYGTDQECWEESTNSERMEYRKAYFSFHVRNHLEFMLESNRGNKTKIKWMIHKLDTY